MTLPKPLRHLCKHNQDLLLNILFKESSSVIRNWFSKKHGLNPGIVSVLHTAGSDLKFHPHVHMIVSGGGLSSDNKSQIKLKNNYLTRQRFLADQFRRGFIKRLLIHVDKGEVELPKKYESNQSLFKSWLNNLSDKQWIVSIQKPLEDLEQIVGYVGRYTKRACLSEYKIKEVNSERVSFTFNDYKNTARNAKPLQATRTLKPVQFLDQLLRHVPNKGFKMVRYFGAYNSYYRKYIPAHKIEVKKDDEVELGHSWGEYEDLRKLDLEKGKPDPLECPTCKLALVFETVVYFKHARLDDT